MLLYALYQRDYYQGTPGDWRLIEIYTDHGLAKRSLEITCSATDVTVEMSNETTENGWLYRFSTDPKNQWCWKEAPFGPKDRADHL